MGTVELATGAPVAAAGAVSVEAVAELARDEAFVLLPRHIPKSKGLNDNASSASGVPNR
jgi:hypothetical protein